MTFYSQLWLFFLLCGLKLICRYSFPFLISIVHSFCWAAYTCHFRAISFNAFMKFPSRCFLKFILCLPSLPLSSLVLSLSQSLQTHKHIYFYYIIMFLLILSLGISYASIYFVSHFDNMKSMHKESSTSFAQKLGPSKLYWVSKIVWLIYSLICSFIQQILSVWYVSGLILSAEFNNQYSHKKYFMIFHFLCLTDVLFMEHSLLPCFSSNFCSSIMIQLKY